MTDREAMKMVLEALEYYRSGEDYQPTPASEAIHILRQALAQVDNQEPVAYACKDDVILAKHWTSDEPPSGWVPLYTASPKREWVGLTDEEMEDCWNNLIATPDFSRKTVYQAIEAKLKEKNA